MSDNYTPEQWQEVERERDYWIDVGMSPARADRPAAELAVARAYRAVDAEPAVLHLWFDSPLAGAVVTWVIRTVVHKARKDDALESLTGAQAIEKFVALFQEADVRSALAEQFDQTKSELVEQLVNQLDDETWQLIVEQVMLDEENQSPGALWRVAGDKLDPWADAYWVALYRQALKLHNEPPSERLESLAGALSSCGWWWPMRGVCVYTERPTALALDQTSTPHGEDGPAIGYADGYELHFWHGVRVPKSLVDPGWDAKKILEEENTEIRRCAIERVGWDQFIEMAGMTAVAGPVDDPGNQGGTLTLFELPDGLLEEPARVLLARNGTPERSGEYRKFGLTVPASITDPVAAGAWTYDLEPEEYVLLERRT